MRILSEVVRFGSVIKKLLKLDINLLTTAVPMIIPSSGSIGNNGALTLTTALSVTYSTGAYMYFPASAISAGSAAGLYWVVMSSTTAGTIYNNTHSGDGAPAVPSSPTAFATTGPGAYTQVTTEVTVLSVTVPGGTMGAHGYIELDISMECPNSVGNKIRRYRWGGVNINSSTLTTSTTNRSSISLANRGVANSQINHTATTFGAHSSGPTYSTVDTTSDVSVTHTLQLATATDWVMISMLTSRIWRS